jgi:hypothetical protein
MTAHAANFVRFAFIVFSLFFRVALAHDFTATRAHIILHKVTNPNASLGPNIHLSIAARSQFFSSRSRLHGSVMRRSSCRHIPLHMSGKCDAFDPSFWLPTHSFNQLHSNPGCVC